MAFSAPTNSDGTVELCQANASLNNLPRGSEQMQRHKAPHTIHVMALGALHLDVSGLGLFGLMYL